MAEGGYGTASASAGNAVSSAVSSAACTAAEIPRVTRSPFDGLPDQPDYVAYDGLARTIRKEVPCQISS